jgi:molecular chaperone GrpE
MSDENDDIVIEDDSDSVSADRSVKKLRDKLKVAEEKAKEYLDSWQRAQADFVNIRKRDEEAKVEYFKFANADLVTQLLPVLDSFNMAIQHGSKDVELVYGQLMQILRQNGLEESDPLGETFDPRSHEALGAVPTDKPEEDNKVLEVVQKGYILSGKIIRPAKVRLGEHIINQQPTTNN